MSTWRTVATTLVFLFPAPLWAQEGDVTRHFAGMLGRDAILLTLEFRADALKEGAQRPHSYYNIHGAYFYVSEPRPTPQYLQGRWHADAGLIGLEAYRVVYHDAGSRRQQEQTAFLAGTIETTWDKRMRISGSWIETNALTFQAFYAGLDPKAKNRLEFSANEGGQPGAVSGTHACRLGSQTLDVSIKDSGLTSFALRQEATEQPLRTCSLSHLDFDLSRTAAPLTLIGRPGSAGTACILSILNLGSRLLVSTEPWRCACRTRVVIDKASGRCFDLFTSQSTE